MENEIKIKKINVKICEKKMSSTNKEYWFIEDITGDRYTAWFPINVKENDEIVIHYEQNGIFKNIKKIEPVSQTMIPANEVEVSKIKLSLEDELEQRLEKAVKIVCKVWNITEKEILNSNKELISQVTGVFIGLGR